MAAGVARAAESNPAMRAACSESGIPASTDPASATIITSAVTSTLSGGSQVDSLQA